MPTIDSDHWKISYEWSTSSGLRLGVCEYRGIRVLHGAAVPFVYVDYQGPFGPFTDQLKSLEGTVSQREIIHGFDLQVSYDWYGPDYRYDHIWRFHDDGQFGSFVIIHGPGEELAGKHTYHIPFRFDLDISGAKGDTFQRWQGYWDDVTHERRLVPAFPDSPDFDWQVIDKQASRRAMIRAHRGDNAECWPLLYKKAEHWGSWGGAQASPPGSPGSVPAIYADGQSIVSTDIVVWYVAHVSALDLVAVCGPWFALEGFGEDQHDDDVEDPHHHH